MRPRLVVVKVDVSVRRVEGVRQHFSGSVERVAVDVVIAAIEPDFEMRIIGRRQNDVKTRFVGPVLRRHVARIVSWGGAALVFGGQIYFEYYYTAIACCIAMSTVSVTEYTNIVVLSNNYLHLCI